MKSLIGLTGLIFILQTGCAHKAVPERNPSSQSLEGKKSLIFTQVVKLESEQRALFMVEDTEAHTFTVAECVSPNPDGRTVLLQGATCTTLSDAWIPSAPELRDTFDKSFNQTIAEENKLLARKWNPKAFLGNLAIGTFVTMVTETVGQRLSLKYGREVGRRTGQQIFMERMYQSAIPRTFVIGLAISAGVAVLAALEASDYVDRESYSIETNLLKKNPSLPRTEAKPISVDIYAAVRRALTSAMNARTTA